MAIYSQIPIRFQASLISNPPVVPVDANTGLGLQFWRAQAVSMQVGIFDAQGLAVDLSNLSAIQLVISTSVNALVPSLVATVTSSDIVPTITVANWNAGTAAQAIFNLTPAQTDFSLNGAAEEDYWLTLVGLVSGGGQIVYAAGPVRIFDPGLPPLSPAPGVGRNRQSTTVNDVTVTPTAQIFTQIVDIAGAARTFNVLLGIAGIKDGAKLDLILNLPATPNIVVNVKSSLSTNPTISTIQTGSVLQALLSYYYDADAVAWVPESYLLPPT